MNDIGCVIRSDKNLGGRQNIGWWNLIEARLMPGRAIAQMQASSGSRNVDLAGSRVGNDLHQITMQPYMMKGGVRSSIQIQ